LQSIYIPLFAYSIFSCQRRRSLLQHGQTGSKTVVQNLKSFDVDRFAILNPMPGLQDDPNKEYYQMGEEGNPPDAYELHITPTMKRLIYRDFTVSNKYPNNIVLTKNNGVCAVSDLSYDDPSDSFLVTISPFNRQNDFFRGAPCNSSDFNIFQVSGGIDYSKKAVAESSEIVNQFVCLLHDREVDKQIEQESADAAQEMIAIMKKRKAHWVCIPLMHVEVR